MLPSGALAEPGPDPRRSPWSSSELPLLLLGGLAAFCAYFAMYAFRKPLAVATYEAFEVAEGKLAHRTREAGVGKRSKSAISHGERFKAPPDVI